MTADNTPKAIVTSHNLVITTWLTGDSHVVAAAQRAEEQGDLLAWFDAVVRAGVLALESVRSSAELQRLETSMDALGATVTTGVEASLQRLDDRLSATLGENGQLALASKAAVDRLAHGIGALLVGPEARVPATLERSIRSVTDTVQADLQRTLSSTAAGLQQAVAEDRLQVSQQLHATLAAQIEPIRASVEEVKAAVVATQATARERSQGSKGGLDYEASLVAAVTALVQRTGTGVVIESAGQAGTDARKLGDLVVELHDGGRIALEVKRVTARRLDTSSWRGLLAGSRRTRAAGAAIGITRRELMPAGCDDAGVVLIGTSDLLVAWDEGDPDWTLAAALALSSYALRNAAVGGEQDAAKTVSALRELILELKPLESIQRHAAGIRRSSEGIHSAADATLQVLTARLTQLIQDLAPAGETATATGDEHAA